MIAVYPGSFDPITNGHLDIIYRASKLCDSLYVAVLNNYSKEPMFSVQERIDMLEQTTKDMKNIKVEVFQGLLIDYACKKNVNVIIRGLRAVSDYEYELQMALANKKLCDDIETIFLVSDSRYSFLSSSLVKEIANYGGNLDSLVPKYVKEKLQDKIKGR